jgi:hypothetical protein
MGKYGIDRKTVEEITGEDCNKMIVEATKIIKAKQDAREVAIAFYDRAWVYAERGGHDKAISDRASAINIAARMRGRLLQSRFFTAKNEPM